MKINKIEKPIRVIHVLGKLNRGGAESMVMNYYRELDKTKYQFDFIVHGDEIGVFEEEIIKMGGIIYRVPQYKVYNHFKYKKEWKKLLSNLPNNQIIHSHIRSTASIFLPIAKKAGFITMVHSHNTSLDKNLKGFIKGYLQRDIAESADALLSCGEQAGKWLFKRTNRDFLVIPNSIDSKKYQYSEDNRNKIRKELSLAKDDHAYIHIGRFHEQKNHIFLIDIFNELQKVETNSKLFLVGNGKLKNNIKETVKNLKLEDKIIFLGVRSDVPVLLQGMDTMIMPSLYEGLPVTLIEAQASGLNIFASDTITKEVDLINKINYLSLNYSALQWSNFIMKYKKIEDRLDMNNKIFKTKYEISNGLLELLSVYNNYLETENYYEN